MPKKDSRDELNAQCGVGSPTARKKSSNPLACAAAMNEEGKMWYRREHFDVAGDCFCRAITIISESSICRELTASKLLRSCHLNLAVCRLAQGRFEDARGCSDSALLLDPKSWKALYRRASALVGMARRLSSNAESEPICDGGSADGDGGLCCGCQPQSARALTELAMSVRRIALSTSSDALP